MRLFDIPYGLRHDIGMISKFIQRRSNRGTAVFFHDWVLYCNVMSRLIRRLFSFAILVMLQLAFAEEPKRKFEERDFPIVETGLQFMSGFNWMEPMVSQFHVEWLSNQHLIVTAAQDVPNANVIQAERTMLVNAQTGESRQLIETGWVLWCFNPARGVGSIRPSPFKAILPYKVGQDDGQYRWVRIESDGAVTKISAIDDLNPGSCLPHDSYPKSAGVSPLREEHGYLQRIAEGKRSRPDDRITYVPRGKPPIPLAVHSMEVFGGRYHYLEYSQKYQLNYFDPHGNSATERRLGGYEWNRPYDLTPFRLLSLDGTVEEIPYPKIIYEYGLKVIGLFMPTPVGWLIASEKSLFLLNGEILTRVWGKPSDWFYSPQFIWAMRLSPNGCKLAFARTADWKPESNKPIAIMELCKGEQTLH